MPSILLPCLQRFYTHLHSYLMAGRFADRLQPWLDAFGPDRWAPAAAAAAGATCLTLQAVHHIPVNN
jgi:hypothetical protein